MHSRWNAPLIDALVSGARRSLLARGVKESRIYTQDVPGSYELPFAARGIAQALVGSSLGTRRLDAVIAIGVLIKGETMHFEYIADAVSHGLMRAQLDTGVPVVFGLLTVLSEAQGFARAGVGAGSHNHGEDWGAAAVELGVKNRRWANRELA